MKYQASIQEKNGYLLVKVSGGFDRRAACEGLPVIREKATQGGFTRLLIDAMEVSAPAAELDRYLVGEAIADILPPPFRIAVLFREELINKFAENTAVNRGADLLVCSSEAEALDWLFERKQQAIGQR